MAMKLKMGDLPASSMPYLTPDAEHFEAWQKRLADLPRPLVGLVWNGRATPNPKRSVPFDALAPLAMEGITFLSLQKGPKAIEAKTPPDGMNLVDLSDEIKDFEDTAAILSIIDLLISIDSAPVHLAGGLGSPAWVMLLHNADWRWFPKREDSPWYPSLHLFRQPKFGDDWSDVVQRVAIKLATWRDQKKTTKKSLKKT
jgi:ADP-heptose:LPS heptosyltransferase